MFWYGKKVDLNAKIVTLAAKVESKAERYKIVELQGYDLSYFLFTLFFGFDGFQNMFIYQPKSTKELNTLLVGNQQRYILLNYTVTYWYSKWLSGYKIEIKSDDSILVVEQYIYTIKLVNGYIVCDLDIWQKLSLKRLRAKKLFIWCK